jgi:hypothetical protein
MNLELVGDILLGILLLGWIGYRQTTWRPVNISQMWRMPLVLGVVGAVMIVQTNTTLSGVDLAFLILESVISLGVGAWMGAIAHFRELPEPQPVGSRGGMALYESRTGWVGLVLWLLVIGVRVGLDVVAAHVGAHAATTTGVILLMLAANRAARVGVFATRLNRPAPVPAR